MSNSNLIFKVSTLMETSTGTREEYSFELPLEYDGLNLISAVSGKVEIMKIEEGFNAKISNLKVKAELACGKCLKKIEEEILVDVAERQYLMTEPDETVDAKMDSNDVYLVNKKDQTIDLGEFIRQEIILHFPSIPVCSKSCKGLCPVCGQDRNKKDCHCETETEEEYKPLSALKDLLK